MQSVLTYYAELQSDTSSGIDRLLIPCVLDQYGHQLEFQFWHKYKVPALEYWYHLLRTERSICKFVCYISAFFPTSVSLLLLFLLVVVLLLWLLLLLSTKQILLSCSGSFGLYLARIGWRIIMHTFISTSDELQPITALQ